MQFNRRAFLKGAGGVSVGLPLLEWGASARAQTAPTRVVFVTVGHSFEVSRGVDSWLPKGDWAALSPLLEPLAAHKDRLLLLSGIDNMVSTAQMVPSNGHNFTSRSFLTYMPSRTALDASGNLLPSPPECAASTLAGGPSIDYVLADALKVENLNLRVGDYPVEHCRSYRVDGTLDAGNPSPQGAFERLFGASAPAMSLTPEQRLRQRRGSVLDAVKTNFDSTLARVGRDDRVRLERHASHIRQLEEKLARTTQLVCAQPKLTITKPLPSNFNASAEGKFDDVVAAAHIDLVATAFACQATRVAHIHFSNYHAATFPFLNGGLDYIVAGWHATVHLDAGTDEQRLKAMRWFPQVVADLLTRLQGTPEGAGTLLDNTLVVFMSSLRQGHATDDLPVLLAGNLAGALRTGRHVHYAPARTTGDLFTTLLQTMGVPAKSFGWDRGVAKNGRPFNSGPLPSWA